MKTKIQLRLAGVSNQIDGATNRHQRLYWTLSLLCTIGDMLRTMSRRQQSLSNRSQGLSQAVDKTSSQQYRYTGGGGWGTSQQGGNWPDHRLSGPDLNLQKDIKSLHRDVAEYNSDYDIIREYAGYLRSYILKLDNGHQCRTVQEVEVMSILRLADRCNESWNGCVDRHDGFERLDGPLLSRIGCSTLKRFKPMQSLSYPEKRVTGIGRTSQGLGESRVEYEQRNKDVWKHPQDVLARPIRFDNYDRQLTYHHRECFHRMHPGKRDVWVGLNAVQYATLKSIRLVERRHRAYRRLVSRVACTMERPGAPTLLTSVPEAVGTILCQGANVRVFRCSCLVVAGRSGEVESSNVYFLERPESELIRNTVQQVSWYHRDCTGINDVDAYNDLAVDVMQTRLIDVERREAERRRWNQSEADRKLGQRKEVAKYAIQLLKAGELSMLDSKNANNCLPGTLEFCRRIGVPLPSDRWTDTRIDARKLLRLWKAADWVRDSLFLSAIRVCVERVQRERLKALEQSATGIDPNTELGRLGLPEPGSLQPA